MLQKTNKMLDSSNSRKAAFILVHRSRTHSIVVLNLEVVGHIAYIVSKHRKMLMPAHFLLVL